MADEAEKMPEKTVEDAASYVAKLKRERAEKMADAERKTAPPPLRLISSTSAATAPPIELLKRLATPEKPKRIFDETVNTAATEPKPEIELGTRGSEGMGEVTANVMKVLAARKAPIYQRAGFLVQPVVADEGFDANGGPLKVASLVKMDQGAVTLLLTDHMRFTRTNNKGKQYVEPGPQLPGLIQSARRIWPFPTVAGLLNAPTLRPDGSLLRARGYDSATRMLLLNSPEVRPINPTPSRADAEEALAVLKELLAEFPFVDEGGRSVALSLILSTMVRAALDQTPLHVIGAPSAGTGKSFLVDIASMIATGETAAVVAATDSKEELEKRIGAELIAGRVLISLDNVNGELRSELLCQAVTQSNISLRPLGSSTVEKISNKSVFSANGINVAPVDDLTRRTLFARLDAGTEKPWERPYEHNPLKRIAADRGRYIAAALTVPLAYLAAGEPDVPRGVNGFERWSRFVRAPLMWLGEADCSATMKAVSEGDPRRQTRGAVLAAMAELFGLGQDKARTTAQVIEAASGAIEAGSATEKTKAILGAPVAFAGHRKTLKDALMVVAGQGKDISPVRLGRWLGAGKDQVVDGLKLCSEQDRHRMTQWWVEPVNG